MSPFIILLAFVIFAHGEEQNLKPRIVGGVHAYPGQFPYQVSLRLNNQHFCGGSIISPITILTAAHCIYGLLRVNMTVVVNTIWLRDDGITYPVRSTRHHAYYDPYTHVNDIALVIVLGTIRYSATVEAIRLPTRDIQHPETLTLSGWGLESYPGIVAQELQYIYLTSYDSQKCANSLAGVGNITTGHVCTISSPGRGACQGDSGGPLVDGQGVQVGVVSWGVPCAKGYPDVFTSVYYYKSWIVRNMLL